MAIPHDHDVQFQLLTLLDGVPDGTTHCRDAYVGLRERFPQLTCDEVDVPYRRSVSHWANRVQFARLHLVRRGFMLRSPSSGRGYWTISPAGRQYLKDSKRLAEELVRELEEM